jgi:CheY-like chemotaxis protein
MNLPPVLYAEDARDDVFFMRRALELAGIPNALVTVKDGQQAIDYLAGQGAFSDRQRHPLPCLLLLDLKLPVRSGFEVLRWVRQQPALQQLRIVIVSGSNQETDLDLARSLGVIDYVVKPSSPRRLLDIVRKGKDAWFGPRTHTPVAP